jgi:hypothetical protein
MKITHGLGVTAAAAALTLASLAGAAGTATASAGVSQDGVHPAAVGGRLYAVAASSAGNAWAVGITPGTALIMHYNGHDWTTSLKGRGVYDGVAVTAPKNAWAVGGTSWTAPSTLIEHWNGQDWTRVPSPSPAPNSRLTSVSATSTGNAWTVGWTGTGSGTIDSQGDKPLIEHWNGTAWSLVRGPAAVPYGQLTGVDVLSPKDAWAVGWTGPTLGAGSQTLIEHWNGTAWTRVASPNPAGIQDNLTAVTATSTGNAWVAGDHVRSDGSPQPLTEHWNGKTWSVVASPVLDGGAQVAAVSASSPGNAWMTGYTNPDTCNPQCATLTEHWNGTAWTQVPAPNPPGAYLNAYLGVLAISADDALAVGTSAFATVLIAHWNGTTWNG